MTETALSAAESAEALPHINVINIDLCDAFKEPDRTNSVPRAIKKIGKDVPLPQVMVANTFGFRSCWLKFLDRSSEITLISK